MILITIPGIFFLLALLCSTANGKDAPSHPSDDHPHPEDSKDLQGDPELQYAAGMKYLTGDGVPRDEQLAAIWLSQAALGGLRAALDAMASSELLPLIDWQSAIGELRDPELMYLLGRHFQSGISLAINHDLACYCYKRAADLGHREAAFELAECLWFGEGCEREEEAAFKWLAKAADKGSENARLALEVIGYSVFDNWEDLDQCSIDWQHSNGGAYQGTFNLKKHYEHTRTRAVAGEPAAMTELAWLSKYGYGVQADHAESDKWYELATDHGDPRGTFIWVTQAGSQHPLRQDFFNQAVKQLEERIAAGDLQAMYELARGYEICQGCINLQNLIGEEDIRSLYLKAAEAGNAHAQYKIGSMASYDNPFDQKPAYKWLLKAATQGHREAQFMLADHHDTLGLSHEDANTHSAGAAMHGHMIAQSYLAIRSDNAEQRRKWFMAGAYMNFYWGNEDDFSRFDFDDDLEKFKWMRRLARNVHVGAAAFIHRHELSAKASRLLRSAKAGNLASQYNLGLCYEFGWGLEPDYIEAFKWLREAALKGESRAQLELGHLFFLGIGIDRDANQAEYWWIKAAEQGDPQGILALKSMKAYHQRMVLSEEELIHLPFAKELEQIFAIEVIQSHAERGDARAQYYYGKFKHDSVEIWEEYGSPMIFEYWGKFHNDQLEHTWFEAISWLRLASYQGFTNARLLLAKIYSHCSDIHTDRSIAEKVLCLFDGHETPVDCAIIGEALMDEYYWNPKIYGAPRNDCEVWIEDDKDAYFLPRFMKGITKNLPLAVKYLRQATQAGYPASMCALGRCYLDGEGIGKDVQEAVSWLKKAADEDHEGAQYTLESMS